MKKLDWLNVAGVNLLFVSMILLPFLPGLPNEFAQGTSLFGILMGFLGLVFVPLGIIWTAFEIKKTKSTETSNWKSTYTLAIITAVLLVAFCLIYVMGITMNYGSFACAYGILLGALAFRYIFMKIKDLKNSTNKSMNPVPFYLMTVPLTALVTQVYFMKPASHFSRNVAIEKSQPLISSIEDFKNSRGHYPENMEDLKLFLRGDMPKSAIMGILEYNYKRSGDAYHIGFKQNLDFGLEEIVVYDKNNSHEDYYYSLKGAFKSHDSEYANWRYFWCN